MTALFISFIIALLVVAVIYYAVKNILPALGLPLPPATMTIINVIFMVIVLFVLIRYGVPLITAVL